MTTLKPLTFRLNGAGLALTAGGPAPDDGPTGGERLSVRFDNPRAMATPRNSSGEAVDLYRERTAHGIWYRDSADELRGEGLLATWTTDGHEPTDCHAID
ncbi:MAG: MliC family protein [Caulobacteraceae bacterium]|nr:MliC family protein [Caulobacteraceae bacterium]